MRLSLLYTYLIDSTNANSKCNAMSDADGGAAMDQESSTNSSENKESGNSTNARPECKQDFILIESDSDTDSDEDEIPSNHNDDNIDTQ